ncbi:hypothetical protein SCHPADRAFT_103395 [Schizopora paradoxa]|uniref:Uncharacterized protein n=1 Tax=Schizopora paradoxa TaxID=27342 RepID=A0A0H2SP25_9AGAM|nr:hypothetical protein SCHPADRAFT_103395 [Schizopora paradoxa]
MSILRTGRGLLSSTTMSAAQNTRSSRLSTHEPDASFCSRSSPIRHRERHVLAPLPLSVAAPPQLDQPQISLLLVQYFAGNTSRKLDPESGFYLKYNSRCHYATDQINGRVPPGVASLARLRSGTFEAVKQTLYQISMDSIEVASLFSASKGPPTGCLLFE